MKWIAAVAGGLALAALLFTQLFSIFVVQPIGAAPKGATFIIDKLENVQLLDSADAICMRRLGGVSLLCRGATLAAVSKNATIHVRLPYSE